MLKLKFYQIENVVLMKVLEQDNKEDLYFEYEDLILLSMDYPAIDDGNRIYLQGSDEDQNNKMSCYDFETNEEAENFINKAMLAVKAYNKKHSQTEDEHRIEIQEFIAE